MKKFKTPIAMKCNQEQYEAIKPKLVRLGYYIHRIDSFINNIYLVNDYGKLGTVSNVAEATTPHNLSSFIFPTWNEDLFLALAAMVEGNIVHEGEYGWFTNTKTGISRILKYPNDIIGAQAGAKASAEQLIAHFEKKEPEKVEDEVYKLYNDDLKDLYKRMSKYKSEFCNPMINIMTPWIDEMALEGYRENLAKYEAKFCDFSKPKYTKGLLQFARIDSEENEFGMSKFDLITRYEKMRNEFEKSKRNVSEFVLPEKWYIKGCDKLYKHFLNSKTNLEGRFLDVGYYPNGYYWNSRFIIHLKQDGYTEITFEQFEKYVLNKTKEMKNNIKLKADDLKNAYQKGSDEVKKALRNLYPDFEFSRFEHLSYVWCWNKGNTTIRSICIWDAYNDCVFGNNGGENRYDYNYYELYTGTPEPFMQQMREICKNSTK